MASAIDTIAYSDKYPPSELVLCPNVEELSNLYPIIQVGQLIPNDSAAYATIHISSYLESLVGSDVADLILEYANSETVLYPVVSRPGIGIITNPNFFDGFRLLDVFLNFDRAVALAMNPNPRRDPRYVHVSCVRRSRNDGPPIFEIAHLHHQYAMTFSAILSNPKFD